MSVSAVKSLWRSAATGLGLLALAGCATQNAQTITSDSRPSALPTVSATNLSGALRCLDEKLVARKVPTTTIVVGLMPDSTGKFQLSLRDMTIHAIVTANRRSGAFRVVDQSSIAIRQAMGPTGGLPLPNPSTAPRMPGEHNAFNFTGSISAAAQSLYNQNISAGISLAGEPGASAGFSLVDQLGSVETSMRLSRFSTNETLYSSQHQLVLRKSERGFDARAGFSDYAVSTGISFSRQDSAAKAVQTLVELHVLELLGKAANVPYWECLSAANTQPRHVNAVSKEWKALSERARAARMGEMLAALGYAEALPQALQRFQIDSGLNATGQPSYETYLALKNAQTGAAARVGAEPGAAPARKTPGISMRANNLGATWRVEIGLAKSAYVNCYYRADDGVIAQIYPNPFNPRHWLAANSTHFIPDTITEEQLYITGRNPHFLCLSAPKDLTPALPRGLKQSPLQDLRPFGITSFKQITDAYARASKGEAEWAIWTKN